MGYDLNGNLISMLIQKSLGGHDKLLFQSQERLASGLRINRASDDAAGLVISERMRSHIRAYEQASQNATNGNSVLNIIDGTLDNINDSLQRMRELTIQAANGTYSAQQRASIRQEITALMDHIDQLARSTRFNGQALLTTSAAASYYIQVGISNVNNTDRLNLAGTVLGDITTSGTLALRNLAFSLGTSTLAAQFVGRIDSAFLTLNQRRTNVGTFQNRFDAVVQSIQKKIQDLSASDSAIRDADVAKEVANQSKADILRQAAVQTLAQANTNQAIALQLLR